MEKDVRDEFKRVDARFEAIDRKFDQMFEFIKSESNRIITAVDSRFLQMESRLNKLALKDEDLEDQIEVLEKAIDKDAVTIVDHGHRISRLEAA